MIAVAVGGTENHVHVLFHLPPKLSLAKAVQLLKGNSSKWMGEQGIDFAWQEGYGAFSVSSSNLDQVARYVRNQAAHHRKSSFEEEFRALLKKHGVELRPQTYFGLGMHVRAAGCAAPPGLWVRSSGVPTARAVGYALSSLTGLMPVCKKRPRNS